MSNANLLQINLPRWGVQTDFHIQRVLLDLVTNEMHVIKEWCSGMRSVDLCVASVELK